MARLRILWGKDCVEVFCKHTESEAKRIYSMFPERPTKRLTLEEWREFKGVAKCHICFNDFEEEKWFSYKMRDHCHYMGLYRGPAHRICNLRYEILRYISVVFHNLSGYDAHLFIRELSHLFIRELGKKFDSESTSSAIGVIAERD